jgi:hypothetical protein
MDMNKKQVTASLKYTDFNGAVNSLTTITPDTPIRYLGLWITLTLNWSKHIRVMNGTILHIVSRFHPITFSAITARMTIRDVLIPRLTLGLNHAKIKDNILKKWDTKLMIGIRRVMRLYTKTSPAMLPTLLYSDTITTAYHSHQIFALLHKININDHNCQDFIESQLGNANKTYTSDTDKLNKICHTKKLMTVHNLKIVKNKNYLHTPINTTPEQCMLYTFNNINIPIQMNLNQIKKGLWWDNVPQNEKATVVIATDGSTPERKDQNSTAAYVLITDLLKQADYDKNVASHYAQSWRIGSNNNLHAELSAILMAIHSVPIDTNLLILTDCLNAILITNMLLLGRITINKLLRLGGRPYYNAIVKAIQARDRRGGKTTFNWVRSHTNGLSHEAKANDLADHFAKKAHTAYEHNNNQDWDLLSLDLKYILCHKDNKPPLHDDVRKTLKRITRKTYIDTWLDQKNSKTQIYRENRIHCDSTLKLLLKKGTGDMLATFVMGVMGTLPSACMRIPKSKPLGNVCPDCATKRTLDSSNHLISCPSTAYMYKNMMIELTDILKRTDRKNDNVNNQLVITEGMARLLNISVNMIPHPYTLSDKNRIHIASEIDKITTWSSHHATLKYQSNHTIVGCSVLTKILHMLVEYYNDVNSLAQDKGNCLQHILDLTNRFSNNTNIQLTEPSLKHIFETFNIDQVAQGMSPTSSMTNLNMWIQSIHHTHQKNPFHITNTNWPNPIKNRNITLSGRSSLILTSTDREEKKILHYANRRVHGMSRTPNSLPTRLVLLSINKIGKPVNTMHKDNHVMTVLNRDKISQTDIYMWHNDLAKSDTNMKIRAPRFGSLLRHFYAHIQDINNTHIKLFLTFPKDKRFIHPMPPISYLTHSSPKINPILEFCDPSIIRQKNGNPTPSHLSNNNFTQTPVNTILLGIFPSYITQILNSANFNCNKMLLQRMKLCILKHTTKMVYQKIIKRRYHNVETHIPLDIDHPLY